MKRVNEEMMQCVKHIDNQMDLEGKSLAAKNKVIKNATGLKSTQTINLMRDSGYNLKKHKELSRERYPNAYKNKSEKPLVNSVEIDNQDFSMQIEDTIYNYLEDTLKPKKLFFSSDTFPTYNRSCLNKINILHRVIQKYLQDCDFNVYKQKRTKGVK